MPQDWISTGIPNAILRDGWWLDDQPPETTPETPPARRPGRRALWSAAGLVILADALFWQHEAGLSLVLFGATIFAAAALCRGRRDGVLAPAILLGISFLPVIEHLQALSLLFWMAGLLVALGWLAFGRQGAAAGARSLLARSPIAGLALLEAEFRAARTAGATWKSGQILRGWALPIGGGLLLLGLLAEANPVLERWLGEALASPDPSLAMRGMFWAGSGLILLPLLLPPAPRPQNRTMFAAPRGIFGVNAASVSRALVLFNLILAVQTAMDAAFLWTGAELPPGTSHAAYAHRGAYPLLVTALLAGAFALAARPWTDEHRGLRLLLLLWLVQNMALVGSALLRLDLYVDAFGVTYLRAHAAIWMALVAAGLGLTLAQIALRRDNGWLLHRAAALGVGTLYLCCFINFADLIVRETLRRGAPIDSYYLCETLGPTAAAALMDARIGCRVDPPETQDWRDWGFRDWRVRRYVKALEDGLHENPDRGR